MPVGKDEFRTALGHFASGVTVVTTAGQDGDLFGITVSAFSSLSLEPPLILICVEKRASIYEHLTEGGFFAVNILAEDQELISRRFATRVTNRFEGIGYTTGATGSSPAGLPPNRSPSPRPPGSMSTPTAAPPGRAGPSRWRATLSRAIIHVAS